MNDCYWRYLSDDRTWHGDMQRSKNPQINFDYCRTECVLNTDDGCGSTMICRNFVPFSEMRKILGEIE